MVLALFSFYKRCILECQFEEYLYVFHKTIMKNIVYCVTYALFLLEFHKKKKKHWQMICAFCLTDLENDLN